MKCVVPMCNSVVSGTYAAPVSVLVVPDIDEPEKMEGPSNLGVITNKGKVTYI